MGSVPRAQGCALCEAAGGALDQHTCHTEMVQQAAGLFYAAAGTLEDCALIRACAMGLLQLGGLEGQANRGGAEAGSHSGGAGTRDA